MPLIIVTGLPSSGKSLLADKIHKFIKQRLERDGISRQVRIVSDSENLDWDGRNSIYMSIPKEKELRAWLRSEAQRYVNLNQIVILDAATYIKGFRYELFCMSKEAKTQYCIVELLIEPEICWKQNQERDSPDSAYDRQTFDALVMRYERCDENNRWDSPLFRLSSKEEELDMEELYAILGENVLVPNKCTSLASTTTSIFKPR